MRIKTIVLTALTVIAAFGGGFYFGAFPDHWHQVLNPAPQRVRLLVEDRGYFPKELQIWLFERTGQKVEVSEAKDFEDFLSQSPNFDLVMARITWLKQMTPQFESWDLGFKDIDKINNDFLSDQLTRSTVIPLLWSVEKTWPVRKNKVKVIGLAKPEKGHLKLSDLQFITEQLLNVRAHEIWLIKTPYASCLEAINNKDFPEERKPNYFRTLDLQNIELF